MKVRAQIAMVLNLDKCIGCHTCSVTCKNVWTSRDGMEYAWFNNVETKPGIGYPKNWENQEQWNGGWKRRKDGKIEPKQGGKLKILSNIFANPDLPAIDDYYEPWDYDYAHLQNAPESKAMPVARPRSAISGERMEKIHWGPNWEEILGTEFAKRSKDYNFENVQKEIYGEFENTFMMYLPRLCEHCLNPACVASCPSGAIYKREEDGIVLIDQDKCRGWRMCVSGCPYKKIYYNWNTGKSEKCIFCYPRIESGQPTVCSETCVGRIRYLGVLLYDADKIEQAASVVDEKEIAIKSVVINLLVRATRYAHPPAPAFVLIDQHNAVFFTLVDRPAGTGGDTGRIKTVFAQARQIHHEGIFKFAVNLLLHVLKVVVFGTLGEFGTENFFPVWPPMNLLHPLAANRRTGPGHRHGFGLWRILQMGVVVIPRLVIIINRRQIRIGEDVG